MNSLKRGVTLVELLGSIVLMSIVATLLGLFISTFSRALNQIYDYNSINSKGLLVTYQLFNELNQVGPEQVSLNCAGSTCSLQFTTQTDTFEIHYQTGVEYYLFWYTLNGVDYEFEIGNYQFTRVEFLPIQSYGAFQHASIEIEISSHLETYTFLFSYITIDYQAYN
jgi:hypothetical protein